MSDELFGGKAVIHFDNPLDRRAFLKFAGAVGVGSSLVAAGVLNTTTAFAASQFGTGDVGILNYALTLEYLESTFYAQGVQANILGNEAAHVTAISGTLQKLGATPVAKPTFKFPTGTFTDKMTFLKTAMTFEETGVKAYHGQVTLIQNPDILAAAASIAGVESRHASVLNRILQQPSVPSPVEAHASMDEILTAIKPFLG